MDWTEPEETALETGGIIREDVGAVVDSDLPFSHGAERILEALNQPKSQEEKP